MQKEETEWAWERKWAESQFRVMMTGPITRTAAPKWARRNRQIQRLKWRKQDKIEDCRKELYLAWGEKDKGHFKPVYPQHLKGYFAEESSQMEQMELV